MERYQIDAPETPDNFCEAPPNFSSQKSSIIKSGKYELKYEEDNYSLLMELHANDYLSFKLRKMDDLSSNYYFNKFNYDEMMKIFVLQEEYFRGMMNLFNFCDGLLSKKKLILESNIEKKVMILKLTKKLKSKEIECELELNNRKIPKNEMLNLLVKEIEEIKNNKDEEVSNKINILNNNMTKFENHAKNLEDRIEYLKEEINSIKSGKNEIFEIKNSKININNNSNINNLNNNKNNDNEKNIILMKQKPEQKDQVPSQGMTVKQFLENQLFDEDWHKNMEEKIKELKSKPFNFSNYAHLFTGERTLKPETEGIFYKRKHNIIIPKKFLNK